MTCKSCEANIKNTLLATDGVLHATVSIENKVAEVFFNRSLLDAEELESIILKLREGKYKTRITENVRLSDNETKSSIKKQHALKYSLQNEQENVKEIAMNTK
jgi:copper chaperone CopZ